MGRSCWEIPSPAEPVSAQGEAEAFGLLLGEGDPVADGEGQGVGEALLTAVADGLADVLVDGFGDGVAAPRPPPRSEEHTSELQSRENLVCRRLLEKKKNRGDARRDRAG